MTAILKSLEALKSTAEKVNLEGFSPTMDFKFVDEKLDFMTKAAYDLRFAMEKAAWEDGHYRLQPYPPRYPELRKVLVQKYRKTVNIKTETSFDEQIEEIWIDVPGQEISS